MLIPVPVAQPDSQKRRAARPLARDENSIKRKFLGAAVLLALSAIVLPLLLDGSGSESRFRRVETVRHEPPIIISADGEREALRSGKPAPGLVNSKRATEAPDLTNVSTKSENSLRVPDTATDQAPKKTDSRSSLSSVFDRRVNESHEPRPVIEPLQPVDIESSSKQAVVASAEPEPNRPLAALPGPDVREDLNLAGSGPWVIQAASFVEHDNAQVLRDRLRDRGYPAFVSIATVEVSRILSNRYRVQVGPLTDRLILARRKREVERLTGAKSIVTPYSR